MREANGVVSQALADAHALWQDRGLTTKFSELVNTVWAKNVDRHEPVELGDDARTLGYVCSRNLGNRAMRRSNGTDHGSSQWEIEGLVIDLPHGALRLSLAGRRFFVMKAPPTHGLTPDWDSLVKWDNESNTRQELAEATRVALAGFTSSAIDQPGLWPFMVEATPGDIRDFLVVWAGEQNPVATAGWMTLPIHGIAPFAGVRELWSPRLAVESTNRVAPIIPTGPSFEHQPNVSPVVTLRPLGAEEQS